MRTRLLLSGVVLTLVALFGWTGTAHATSEEELREECIQILEEGGSVDDCQEAPSPILPEANELIWGALSFLVVFGRWPSSASRPSRRASRTVRPRSRVTWTRPSRPRPR